MRKRKTKIMNKLRNLIITIRKQNPQISQKELFTLVHKECTKESYYSNSEDEIIREEIWERLMNSNETFKIA